MSPFVPAAAVRDRVAGSPRAAYDRLVAADLPALLTGYGPLPGAAAVEESGGTWGEVGATRLITFTDGGTARERVLAADRPADAHAAARFAYRVSGYTNALRLLARHADGDWRFAPDGRGGATVTWTYTFRPRSRAAAALLWPVVLGPLRGYMKRVLKTFAA